MLLRRLYEDMLSQASYIIACDETREAIVIDPNRDVDKYLAVAKADKLKITHVTETHIHADFVSGAWALAEGERGRAAAERRGRPDWQYRYAADAGARLLHDGDSIKVGTVKVDVMHTPGIRPEHIAFLITDTASAPSRWGCFGRLHLRRRRRPTGPSREGGGCRQHDGGDGAPAVPVGADSEGPA